MGEVIGHFCRACRLFVPDRETHNEEHGEMFDSADNYLNVRSAGGEYIVETGHSCPPGNHGGWTEAGDLPECVECGSVKLSRQTIENANEQTN